jgi:type I restriction enzyme, S subunit
MPSDREETKLPSGWRTVRFGDVVRNVKVDVDPATSGLERYIAGEHMETDNLRIRRYGTIGEGYLGPAFHRKFARGQVLYGSRRTYLRKVAVADFDGVCANTTFVLEPNGDELIPELLPFILQTDAFNEHSIKRSRGSVNPYINWSDLVWYEFSLPPLDEQRRIAEILWAAEEEREAFGTLLLELSQFVERLGRHFFAETKGQRVTFVQLVLDGNLEFQTGPFGTVLKAAAYVSEGTPIVNPVNMNDGRFVTESGPFLNREECNRLAKYQLKTGDIVLGRKGDVGRGVYVTDEYSGFILGSDCIRLRLSGDRMLSEYVYCFLTSSLAKTWMAHHAAGTTMPGINEPLLARMQIRAPTLEVQTEVVKAFYGFNRTREAIQNKIAASRSLKEAMIDRLLQG